MTQAVTRAQQLDIVKHLLTVSGLDEDTRDLLTDVRKLRTIDVLALLQESDLTVLREKGDIELGEQIYLLHLLTGLMQLQ
jgi:hypothetical protein